MVHKVLEYNFQDAMMSCQLIEAGFRITLFSDDYAVVRDRNRGPGVFECTEKMHVKKLCEGFSAELERKLAATSFDTALSGNALCYDGGMQSLTRFHPYREVVLQNLSFPGDVGAVVAELFEPFRTEWGRSSRLPDEGFMEHERDPELEFSYRHRGKNPLVMKVIEYMSCPSEPDAAHVQAGVHIAYFLTGDALCRLRTPASPSHCEEVVLRPSYLAQAVEWARAMAYREPSAGKVVAALREAGFYGLEGAHAEVARGGIGVLQFLRAYERSDASGVSSWGVQLESHAFTDKIRKIIDVLRAPFELTRRFPATYI